MWSMQRSLIAPNISNESIWFAFELNTFAVCFSPSSSFFVRTSSIADDFHIIVLQEFPLNTSAVCWYFFLTLSRIVIVTFIQLTWLLFFLLFVCWAVAAAAIFLLLVFFSHTQSRNVHGILRYTVYILRQLSHSLIFNHSIFFWPQRRHMYTTTHDCQSNNVMRFLMEPDCGSISLTCHKKHNPSFGSFTVLTLLVICCESF